MAVLPIENGLTFDSSLFGEGTLAADHSSVRLDLHPAMLAGYRRLPTIDLNLFLSARPNPKPISNCPRTAAASYDVRWVPAQSEPDHSVAAPDQLPITLLNPCPPPSATGASSKADSILPLRLTTDHRPGKPHDDTRHPEIQRQDEGGEFLVEYGLLGSPTRNLATNLVTSTHGFPTRPASQLG